MNNDEMSVKYDQAEAFFDQENYEEAIALYQELAAQGHMMSIYSLGWCYYKGVGVEKNYVKAIEMLSASYALGHARSAHMIGFCYRYGGYGIEKDYVKAIEMYTIAYQLGETDAVGEIACCYEEGGPGIEMDYQKALEWYNKAAENGAYNSYYKIGCIYEELGDSAKAKIAYEKGVEHEDPDSYAGLGGWYVKYESNTLIHTNDIYRCASKSYELGSFPGAVLLYNFYKAFNVPLGLNCYLETLEVLESLHKRADYEDELREFVAKSCDEVTDAKTLFVLSKKYYEGVGGISFLRESLVCLTKVLDQFDNDPSRAPFAADLVLQVATVHLNHNIGLYNLSTAIGILELAYEASYCTDEIRFLLAESYDRSDDAEHKYRAEEIMCMLASKNKYERAIEYCSAKGWSQEKLDQEKKVTEYIAKGLCSYCGGNFKGLFKKTCTKCGKAKNY